MYLHISLKGLFYNKHTFIKKKKKKKGKTIDTNVRFAKLDVFKIGFSKVLLIKPLKMKMNLS